MVWVVQTTDGTLAYKGPSGDGLAEEEAVASAEERNNRAAQAGLKVRYEAAELAAKETAE